MLGSPWHRPRTHHMLCKGQLSPGDLLPPPWPDPSCLAWRSGQRRGPSQEARGGGGAGRVWGPQRLRDWVGLLARGLEPWLE